MYHVSLSFQMIRPKRENHLGEHFSMSSKLVHVATDLKMQSTSRTMLPSEYVVNFVFDLIRFKKKLEYGFFLATI